MKRIFFVLLAAVFVSGACFGQEASAPSLRTPAKIQTFTGVVDSVLAGDEAIGTKPKLAIRDRDGQVTDFVIAPDTIFIGKDGNPTTMTWTEGNKVTIEYTEHTTQDSDDRIARTVKILQES